MAYAIIDRRNSKLVKVAVRKVDLPKDIKGLIIDTRHVDTLEPQEVIQAIRALRKDPTLKIRVTPKIREELVETLEQKAQRADVHKSTVDSPVATVWDLCNKMEGSTRKEIIEAAVKAGVTEGTAKTQYQYWKTDKASQDQKKENGEKATKH